jgi:hypothetical protein
MVVLPTPPFREATVRIVVMEVSTIRVRFCAYLIIPVIVKTLG